MKIMYLLFSFTVGGTEKLITDICNEMVKKKQKVYLYIVNKHYTSDMFQRLDAEVVVKKQERICGSGNILNTMINIYKYVRKNEIEIIHCNAFDTPELIALCKLLRPKTKIIYTIHDVGQYKTLNKFRIIYRNWICNSIIAISKSVEKDIIEAGADKDKVKMVYNAINIERFVPEERYNFNSPYIVIGNVARIDVSKKGQDILIEAISKVKNRNIKCVFAGEADQKQMEEANQLKFKAKNIEKLSGNVITFLGNINNIPGFLSKINIFILPSRFEGFGISLIEAMSMKIPCISSNIDGPKEIIGEEERGYLFEAENPQALAEKIDYVIGNYEEAKEKAEHAYKYVKDNFDIKEMCNKLLKLYD